MGRNTNMGHFCQYPVVNTLAVGARPRFCGTIKESAESVPTLVPYGDMPDLDWRMQLLCLRHSAEVATWKLAMSLKTPFTTDELALLHAEGYPYHELADFHGPFPVDAPNTLNTSNA